MTRTYPPATFAAAPVSLFSMSGYPGHVWFLNSAGLLEQKTLYDDVPSSAASQFIAGANDDAATGPNLTIARGPKAGKICVTNLHNNFFGINPNTFPPSFYDGANVTIQTLPVTDSETSLPQTGQIAMYVTKNLGSSSEQYWEIPLTVTSGNTTVPNNLVPVLYSSNSTIPRGAGVQYWMEGVKPGNCTLQFTYTSGTSNLTLTTNQTFLVCTQQSKFAWQEEIRQLILLETNNTVDMDNYQETNDDVGAIFFLPYPFLTNIKYIQNVYHFYQELYLTSNDTFLWTGLANMAGGGVYGGLVDGEYARTIGLRGIGFLVRLGVTG